MSDNNAPQIKYDAFISFKGEEIRQGFLSTLIEALDMKKINVFEEEKSDKGAEIWLLIVEAIKRSSISLIIFSPNYASSHWCLRELVKIVEYSQKYERIVIPVFYHIQPWEVHFQKGRYEYAFAEHERKHNTKEVQLWRLALHSSAVSSGIVSSTFQTNAELVNDIVNFVLVKLHKFPTPAMDKFLRKIMERVKLKRFIGWTLSVATNNFSTLLGSGGFGQVYKGNLFDGTPVAVKVLREISDEILEEQFMAEVSALGIVDHVNLVQLHGFCFESNLKAVVYEYMENGSLDRYLFEEKNKALLGYEKLYEIAIGTARGIAYLHEDCYQRIIHYDIKPANILLDSNFNPKVADFGLSKFNNEGKTTHITGVRGTPGYNSREMCMPGYPITHKCDVYSFGMLLFEIIGRRRNFDTNLPESRQRFPVWVWKRFDAGELEELIKACEIEERHKEMVERMVKVALSCIQDRPASRPMMSDVVKMLEGSVEISQPLNPYQHMMDGTFSDHHSVQALASTNIGGDDQWSGYLANVYRWLNI